MMYVEICRGINILNKFKNKYEIIFNEHYCCQLKKSNKNYLDKLLNFYKLLNYSFINKKFDTPKLISISNKFIRIITSIIIKNKFPKYKKYLEYLSKNIKEIKICLLSIEFKPEIENNDDHNNKNIKKILLKNIDQIKNNNENNGKSINMNTNINEFFDEDIVNEKKSKCQKSCCYNSDEKYHKNKQNNEIVKKISSMTDKIIKNFYMITCICKIYYENSKNFLNNFTIYEAEKKVDIIDIELYNTILKNFYDKFKDTLIEIRSLIKTYLSKITLKINTQSLKFCEFFNIELKEAIKGNRKFVIINSNQHELIFSYLSNDTSYEKMFEIIDTDLLKVSSIQKILNANIFIINQDLQTLESLKGMDDKNINKILFETGDIYD